MENNRFKALTDEMRELYWSCRDSGFTETQAFELTKTYCSIAFVNHAISNKEKACNYKIKREVLRHYAWNKEAEKQNSGTREGT